MNQRQLHPFAPAALWCLCALAAGCNRQASSTPAAGDRPVIVVSIFPLFSLVLQLTGEWADVQLLMPPGSNPHDFELQPSQMAPLSHANVAIVVGLNLDGWAERAARQSGRSDLKILRMADLVPETAPSTSPRNQHLWMNVASAGTFVLALAHQLDDQFPEHGKELDQRATALSEQLSSLDDECRAALANVKQKQLVSFHNAYDPLAERYGLRVVSHLTEIDLTPGGEVTPRDLVQAIEAVRKYHLRAIYAEPQFPARAAEMLRQEVGVTILSLDDLGGPGLTGYDSYQAMIRSDVQVLKKGQSFAEAP